MRVQVFWQSIGSIIGIREPTPLHTDKSRLFLHTDKSRLVQRTCTCSPLTNCVVLQTYTETKQTVKTQIRLLLTVCQSVFYFGCITLWQNHFVQILGYYSNFYFFLVPTVRFLHSPLQRNPYFFNWVLMPVKIISHILRRVNHNWARNKRSTRKTT